MSDGEKPNVTQNKFLERTRDYGVNSHRSSKNIADGDPTGGRTWQAVLAIELHQYCTILAFYLVHNTKKCNKQRKYLCSVRPVFLQQQQQYPVEEEAVATTTTTTIVACGVSTIHIFVRKLQIATEIIIITTTTTTTTEVAPKWKNGKRW